MSCQLCAKVSADLYYKFKQFTKVVFGSKTIVFLGYNAIITRMTPHELHGGAGEQIALSAPELLFAEPDTIGRLREYHRYWTESARSLEAARLGNASDPDAFDEAYRQGEERVAPLVDDDYSSHIERNTINMPGDLHDRLVALLPQFSYRQMSDEEWNRGIENADGTRQSSGQERLQQAINDMRAEFEGTAPTPTTDPNVIVPPPAAPEIPAALIEGLRQKRETLAELSIKRRHLIRKNSRKARNLHAEYEDTEREYDALALEYKTLLAEQHRANGLDGVSLKAQIIHDYLDEHTRFTNAELEFMQNERGPLATVARWLSTKGRLMEIVNGVASFGVGAGSKAALGGILTTAGAATAGIAIPVTIASFAAIKGTQGAIAGSLVNRVNAYRKFEDRQAQDHKLIEQQSNAVDFDGDHASFINKVYEFMRNTRNNRIETDRSTNLRSVLATIAISGAAAAGGELFSIFALPHIESFIHHIWPHGHTTHPSTKPPAGATAKPPAGAGPSPKYPPGTIDGFQQTIAVPHGAGYDQMLTSLVAEKGIHLDGAQSWLLYNHLQNTFGSHIFTDNTGYLIGPHANDLGIGHAGVSHWNHHVLNEVNNWLAQHNLTGSTTSTAKKKVSLAIAKNLRLVA